MNNKILVYIYFLLTVLISSFVVAESVFAQEGIDKNKVSTANYEQMMVQAFEFVKKAYVDPIDEEAVFEGTLKGMFQALNDPYSQYLTKKDLEEISKTTVGDYVGVGLSITKKIQSSGNMKSLNPDDIYVVVISPFEGSPAFKVGIKSGDYITAVDGKSVIPMTTEEVSDMLKGKVNTKVKVSILRGKDLKFDLEIIREKIEIQTIKFDTIGTDVGYIRIIQFNPHTSTDFEKAIEELKKKNVKSLILDLRSNPGGFLQSAIKMANDLLPEGIIVSTKSRYSADPIEYKSDGNLIVDLSIKMVALIDKGSASASEVLVGALKDHKRAYVIGEKSYGKGVIQQVIPFYTGGFKITTSKYYTPSGESIHGVGINPDLKIEIPDISEDEGLAYKDIFDNKLIDTFLENKKTINKTEIDTFIDKIINKNPKYKIDREFLGRLVLLKFYQNVKIEFPIYNMDYDRTLKIAYEYLQKQKVETKF